MTKILVVEDSATQAQELALLLEHEGFMVAIARDGLRGLEMSKSADVDAVLSDVVMPELDGYELCKRIKAAPETQAMPVVLLTSLTDPMDIVRGLECGADNFIPKPYDSDYLIGRVRRLLDNRTLRTQRKVTVGVDVLIMGKRFTVNSDKEQMLDLLISTFEEVLRSRQREYETRLREETVRQSHRFLQSALDALSTLVAIVDQRGKIIAVNAPWRSFAKQWSWPDAGIGADYLEICRETFPTDPEELASIISAVYAVQHGERQRFATEYATRIRNEPKWFTLSVKRFEDHGEPLLAVEHEDVTARKQIEQRLQHSQKMEAIGQLAGGVAHDFNNLLTVINAYAQLLANEFPPEDQRSADVAEILQAASTASSLTRQLLTFGRKQAIEPKVLHLNSIVDEMEKMLRMWIGNDIDYDCALDPALGKVRADPSQMQQILMNLVVNARDAMPKGGKLTLKTANITLDEGYAALHSGLRAGRYVMLAVSDSGIGMDAETQSHIFEPFYTTKEIGKGTGLGLSTVYGIVHQSGGHIRVFSECGHGTTFKLYLPRVDQGQLEQLQQDHAE